MLVDFASNARKGVDEVAVADPDISRMLTSPASFRGQLFQLSGQLVMNNDVTRPLGLKPGTRPLQEWIVRSDKGIPFIVYVVTDGNRSASVGQDVTIDGRFYKRLRLQARDGNMKNYAAFVSPGPTRHVRPEGMTAEHGWGVVVLIVFLVLILLFVLLVTRRARRNGALAGTRMGHALATEVDDGRPLPDDPVEALGELRRRAGEQP